MAQKKVYQFPILDINKAKKQTEEEKKALNYDNIDEQLEKLNI